MTLKGAPMHMVLPDKRKERKLVLEILRVIIHLWTSAPWAER